MHPYRCQNPAHPDRHGRLIFDFWAEAPLCPQCGADDPDVVIRLVVIHLNPPHPKVLGKGTGHLACNNKRIGGGAMASGDPGSVNCPRCKETDAFKQLASRWEEDGGEIMRQSLIAHQDAFKPA